MSFGWKRPIPPSAPFLFLRKSHNQAGLAGRDQLISCLKDWGGGNITIYLSIEALQCISSIVHERPYYNAYCCSVLCATTTFVLEKQNDLESRLQTGVNLNFAILQFVWKATDALSNIIEQAV